MKTRATISMFLLGVLAVAMFVREDGRPGLEFNEPADVVEHAKLVEMQKHYQPESPEGLRVAERIRKIERRVRGYAKPEKPNEFARILHEMRIPYGEIEPAYPLNYKSVELQKARASRSPIESTLPWVERGPGNIAGRARGLIVDPIDPLKNTWYVGSVGGGVWKTTNGGTTWRDLTPGIPNLAASVIEMAPSNNNIIYVGTGESFYNIDVVNGDGILKSTDRGETWFQLPSTINNPNFNNIARIIIDPDNENILLAATTSGRYKINTVNKSGIFKSTDGGQSWYEVYNETEIGAAGRRKRVLHIIATPGNFNVQYAAVREKGILKSTDAGESWFPSSTGITDFTGRYELSISPVNVNKIFAAAEGSPTSRLWVSTNAGATWVNTVENGTEPNWLSAQGWYDNTIVCHPYDENIVYVGGVNLYKIVLLPGNMRTSTRLTVGPVHVDHHNLVILAGEGTSFRILNANDGGIGVSADSSVNWTKPTLGMNTSQFYGVDKKPGASAYIGGMQDNGTWRSPENTAALTPWVFQIGGDGYEASWHFNDPNRIIGGSQYNGLRRSTNGGQSWVSATSGLATGSANAPFITKIAKTNTEPDLLFAVGASGVYRSTNFGQNWALTSIPGANWGPLSSFLDVKISRANPNVVWAGSRMDGSGRINVSTNKGTSFSPTSLYGLTTMGGVSGLSTHPWRDSTAYVLFSFAQKPKVLRTTDLGQTWEDISGFGSGTVSTNGFPDVAVYDLLVMPHTPETLWVGTEIGLFESTNNGATWQMANNGLPNVCIWAMTHVEEEVVLATHGRGVWSVNIPGLSAGQVYPPLLKTLAQGPDGALSIALGLRSSYDSSVVTINGTPFATLGANSAAMDTIVKYPVMQAATVTVGLTSYLGGVPLEALSRAVSVQPFAPAQQSFAEDFNSLSAPFFGNFQQQTVTGFTNGAIHSAHPYTNNLNITYTLTVPIVVASTNAYLAYDDVALVEPGDPGTVFGDANFWDYVIVEGSRDGIEWLPLLDGYDARLHPEWQTAYTQGTSGNASLFRHHEVNLLDTFASGEHILVRFRMYTDASVTGWGWAVDNLEIQERLTNVGDTGGLPATFALQQNFPNPFNPATIIRYALPEQAHLTLRVYNALGQEVTTLVDATQHAGNMEIRWEGRNSAGKHVSTGTYFLRLDARGASGAQFTSIKKMIFLK
jgi:photosystem II stability/assembly factor-like uncharacterized protein